VFTGTTYGFGSTSVDKVINTKTLHYAIVPLLFQYHFNDKNAISIGGSISYLVNSKSKVTINTTTIAPMVLDSNQTGPVENQTISTQSTETGYYSNAFNKWDASLAIGYRRRISQKFSLAAIANIGLLDVKDNVFFSREMDERNVGLKIIISYNLFEF
ncbi:MAG: outer membrane beta-barrel protein, partial [Bacteroidota bacterium]|nr:outer membrane beta-barrel protein [Bacteroidota bacterium]